MRIIFVAILLALGFSLATARADEVYLTESQAKEELQIAVDFIKNNHPDPFWHTSQDEFEFIVRRIGDFHGDISIAKHYFNLAEVYALVVDTHTQLYPTLEHPIVRETYPIRVRGFSEGLYIAAADDPYRAHVGKRIVSIGDESAGHVLDTLSRYSFSGNFYRKRLFAEMFFYWPEMYENFGLTEADGSVRLVLEDREGALERVLLQEKQPISFAEIFHEHDTSAWPSLPEGWATLGDLISAPPPLYLKNLSKNYWYAYLEEEKAMYVQINRPFNHDDGQTALEMNLEWFDLLRVSEVERFILDVRHNPGGWINVTEPIPALLSAYRIDKNEIDEYIVLIGTDSISAGTVSAAQMEQMLGRTITIGQPTGSAPNLFLNANKMVLPHSKFELEVSTVMMPGRMIDDRMFIAPDIWIENSFKDYMSGEDPVMEAALKVTEKMRKEFHADQPAWQGWRRKSQEVAYPRRKP